MERVGALIQKLQAQYDQNVDKKSLLVTVQMLLAELESTPVAEGTTSRVSVVLPKVHRIQQDVAPEIHEPIVIPTTVTEKKIGPAPEVAPAATQPAADIPETIRSYVLKPPAQQAIPSTPKAPERSGLLFDPVEEPPTLPPHREVYELNDVHIDGNSLNDKLKEEKTEVASTIKADTVHDLRKAIGINDRYRFINELFRGDEDMYERSIKTINGFSSLPEARSWIERELIVKIGWVETNATVLDFDQVVKRRFS